MSNPKSGGAPGRRAVLRAGVTVAAAAAALPGAQAVAAPRTVATSPGVTPKMPAGAAPSGRWDKFNLSPASRTVVPVAVHGTSGEITQARSLVTAPASARTTLRGEGASITLDFGKEVGGFVVLTLGDVSDDKQVLGLTYSELSSYISTTSSDASGGGLNHEPPVCYAALRAGRISTRTSAPLSGADSAAAPASQLRGGFRYLTVVNQTPGSVTITGASVEITFAPNVADLRAYPNYFSCSDDLLTGIWYAGAYTVQTNIIANHEGRVWRPPAIGWNNSAQVGEAGDTVLADGAKRDRTVWPGDLGIAVLADYVSLGDMRTVRNSLQTLYNHQDAATGALPYVGPMVNKTGTSDTYHLWTLIGTASYLQFSDDTAWAKGNYGKYKLALDYIVAKLDGDGLLNVTSVNDWARTNSDGKNIEANAIMYRALITGSSLAEACGDAKTATDCAKRAAALKRAIEAAGYWDPSRGLYRDRPGSALYPQDGNSLMVWFGLVDDADRAHTISRALRARWTPVGAATPEKNATSVHPFPGSMEVHAHFEAGRNTTGVDLIRLEWGYMLRAPQGTKTFWEGYKSDGTPDYNGSYMSAAHGWSTGPTSALTFYVLGIRPAPDGGAGYRIAPRPSGLSHAEGQLTTPAGVLSVAWQDRGKDGFTLILDAPKGAVSRVSVPVLAKSQVVRVDGATAWKGSTQAFDARYDDAGYVHLSGVAPGRRTITVRRG